MQERRGITDSRSLCNGPGKVCKSFNIDRSFNYTSLVDGDLTIRQPPPESPLKNKIVTTTRIGITKGIELSYRFILDGSHYISRSMKI